MIDTKHLYWANLVGYGGSHWEKRFHVPYLNGSIWINFPKMGNAKTLCATLPPLYPGSRSLPVSQPYRSFPKANINRWNSKSGSMYTHPRCQPVFYFSPGNHTVPIQLVCILVLFFLSSFTNINEAKPLSMVTLHKKVKMALRSNSFRMDLSIISQQRSLNTGTRSFP